MMDPAPVTGPRLALLRRLGFAEVTHDSHVPFLSHLIGTRRVLAEWGSGPELCDAGLFHSVYGTEYFDLETEVSRAEVSDLIGARAERLAWLWCTIRRDEIDPTTGVTVDRHTGAPIVLDPRELGDIATLWAADTVEQLHRMNPDERRFSDGLTAVLACASTEARHAAEECLTALN